MRKYLIIVFFFLSLNSFAQSSLDSLRCYGGSAEEYSAKMTKHKNSIYACGFTESNDKDITKKFGQEDIWVFKTDMNGNLLKQISIGSIYSEAAVSILASKNRIYVAANVTGPNGMIPCGNMQYSVALCILDTNLSLIKILCYGAASSSTLGMAFTHDSTGLFITGETNKSTSVDIYLVKTDTLGTLVWEKTYSGNKQEVSFAVKATSDGGCVIAGQTWSDALFGPIKNIPEVSDAFIAKMDANGDLQWGKRYGGNYDDEFQDIIVLKNGNYAAVGETSSMNGDIDSLQRYGYSDLWTCLVSSNGTLLSSNTYGSTGQDHGFSIAEDEDGNLIATGDATNNNGDVIDQHIPKLNFTNAWVLKVKPTEKKILWQKCLGGTNSDRITSIVSLSNKQLLLLGRTTSNDRDITRPKGDADFFLTKVTIDYTVGVSAYPDNSPVSIYPNPFTNTLTVQYSTLGRFRVSICDLTARTMWSGIVSNGEYISTEKLSDGLYILSVEKDGKILSRQKVVKASRN